MAKNTLAALFSLSENYSESKSPSHYSTFMCMYWSIVLPFPSSLSKSCRERAILTRRSELGLNHQVVIPLCCLTLRNRNKQVASTSRTWCYSTCSTLGYQIKDKGPSFSQESTLWLSICFLKFPLAIQTLQINWSHSKWDTLYHFSYLFRPFFAKSEKDNSHSLSMV